MHTEKPEILPEIRLSRFSAVGDGMHVEVSAPVEAVDTAGPILTFREDERLGKQVVLHFPDRDIVFPLSELQRAITYAEAEVHKESFYD